MTDEEVGVSPHAESINTGHWIILILARIEGIISANPHRLTDKAYEAARRSAMGILSALADRE